MSTGRDEKASQRIPGAVADEATGKLLIQVLTLLELQVGPSAITVNGERKWRKTEAHA